MITSKRLAITAFILLAPAISVAEVVVSHYEAIQNSHLSKTAKDARSFDTQLAHPAETTLRFEALGQTFDLQLEINDRVASGLQANPGTFSVGVYRGKLKNNPESWARIVVSNGEPRGMIWDGTEMYAIEAPGDSALAVDSTVIYRLADAHIVSGTMSCGSDALSGNAAAVMKGLVASTKAAIARAPGAVSEITMSAIGDFDFTQARGSDAAAIDAITARLNNVDGFFSEQVGVQITLEDIELISDVAVPFSDSLISDDLLDELSEYRLQTERHNTRGLTHLFTGKNLAGTTVGVAWRGTLCSREFGSGLTEGRFGATEDSLIAAHEIGHNFGAEHDGEAMSSCEAETGAFIMAPSINGSDQFSDCSIDVMQASAAAARCVSALPTVDVGIEPLDQSGRVFLGVESDMVFEVSSNGALNAEGVATSFTIPGILDLGTVTTTLGTCTSGAGTVDCDLGELAGLSVQTITLAVTPNSPGAGTLDSSASTTPADADERLSNNQYALQLVVELPVDLVVNAPTAAGINLNETADVTGVLENNSDVDATGVTLSVTLQAGLRADTATWSIGTCTVTPQQIDCTTDVFPARTTSNLTISATALSAGPRNVTVNLNSSEADSMPADNNVVGQVVVTDPNANNGGGGGGGGGTLNPLLILLGLLAIRGGRRRHS